MQVCQQLTCVEVGAPHVQLQGCFLLQGTLEDHCQSSSFAACCFLLQRTLLDYVVLAAQHPSQSHAGTVTPLPSSLQYQQKMPTNDQAGVSCATVLPRHMQAPKVHGLDTRSLVPSRLTSSTYIL